MGGDEDAVEVWTVGCGEASGRLYRGASRLRLSARLASRSLQFGDCVVKPLLFFSLIYVSVIFDRRQPQSGG
jgi:hypothetical protein